MRMRHIAHFLRFFLLVALAPVSVSAYGQGGYYGQGAYYSQSYYQASYSSSITPQTTITADTIFADDLSIADSISKGFGTFMIDHPLDPLNKLLFHSFVESNEIKNLYDGIAVLNSEGEATVRLPDYFEALNTDFRYQLKPIGKPMPDLHVQKEITENQFVIAGGESGGEVSWQVTGNRKDAYVVANPLRVEVRKGPQEIADVGEYLFYGYEPAFTFSWKLPDLAGLWRGVGAAKLFSVFTSE